MSGPEEHLVYLGLGSNLGDRRENLLAALRLLQAEPEVRVLAVSSLYESEPWGFLEQPDFLNLVALVSTSRDPRGMLEACRHVEDALGRVRGERWGPRVIDVDILLYDDLVWEDEELVIPHPRIGERDFVTVPLAELRGARPGGVSPACGRGASPESGASGLRWFGRFEEEEWHG